MTSPTTEPPVTTGIPFFGHFFAEKCFRVSLFAIFSTDSKSASNSAFFFKTAQKNENVFCKCVLELNFAIINNLESQVVKTSLLHNVTCTLYSTERTGLGNALTV
jgi:hypothetical protein